MTTPTIEQAPDARKQTIVWIVAGAIFGTLLFIALFFLWPEVSLPDQQATLHFALKLSALPAFFAFLVLQACWRVLDTAQAEDPLAGNESRRWKINQRVLTNTVEQSLMFVPAFLALSATIEPSNARMLAILMTTWITGRALFWGGYHIGLRYRAIGMDTTTVATAMTYVWLARGILG